MLASEKRAARGLLPDAATLWIRFALRGEALGLTPPLAEQDLRVCVECSAYSEDKGARPEAFNPPVMQAAEDGLPQD
jgi:hypothetical protein